jgi:hypothetical protein
MKYNRAPDAISNRIYAIDTVSTMRLREDLSSIIPSLAGSEVWPNDGD